MGLRLHPPEACLQAVLTALERDRPVALVLGSSLAAPLVPAGAERVALVTRAVAPYPTLAAELRTTLEQAPWGHEADVAVAFLGERLGEDEVPTLVRRAVRLARRPDARALPDDRELEADLDGWRVTRGLRALGGLLADGTGGLAGPVLSLGWDPLLEIAVLQAGGRVQRRVVAADGHLDRTGRGAGVPLIHLAGHWREPGSLGGTREASTLATALAPALRDHAVIVLGATPRDTAWVQALVALTRREDSQQTLTWAFQGFDRVQVKTDARALLQRCEPLVRTGRFRTYGGVDPQAWLVALAAALKPAPEPVVAPTPEAAPVDLPGWSRVTPELLSGGPDLAAFAEGLSPGWAEIGSGRLAARDRVKELVEAVSSKRGHKRGWSIHLLLGPPGEGKSTVARQVAAQVSRRGDPWRVWWRDQGGLRWDQVSAAVGRGERVLLVSDDAEGLQRRHDLDGFLDPRKLPGRVAATGAAVHVLLVADAEAWRAASRQKPRWLQASEVVVHRSLHALGLGEARRFVLAAEAVDQAGALGGLPDLEARAAHLVALSQARDHSQLLGALVQGRTGQDLEQHVSAWLLDQRGKRSTRFPKPLRAWLHAAALSVAGLGALDRRILQAALDTDEAGVDAALAALPGWLTAEQHGRARRVRVGSEAVARVTLDVLDGLRLGLDRAGLYASLATAALTGVRGWAKDRRVQAVPRLAERLWRTGQKAEGLAMAAAAHAAAPSDPGFARTHARLQRESGQPAVGAEALGAWVAALRTEDPQAPLARATLQEWTACVRGADAPDAVAWSAWLALFALSDQPGTPLKEHALRGLIGVADRLRDLDPEAAEPRAVQGRAAAVAALQHAPQGALGPREREALEAHGAAVDGLWRHLSPGAVGACLSGVAVLAWQRVEATRHSAGLPADGRLTFQGLGAAVQGQGPPPRPARGPRQGGQGQRQGGRRRGRRRKR